MKTKFLQLSFLLIFSTSVFGQYFAPLGATWHYRHSNFSPLVDFNKLTVVDTAFFINGKYCSKIIKTILLCSPQFEFVYFDNNVVFKLNQESNQFDTLYNFNLNAGQGWGNTLIDSVVFININGTLLKGLYVNGETYGGPIIERIGSPLSFISDNPVCDPIDGGWIRCYSDSILGQYSFSSESCEAISNINKITDNAISIYPNPVDKFIKIKNVDLNKFKVITLYNSVGTKIISKEFVEDVLNIEFLPSGLYLLQLSDKESASLTRIIIKK